MSHYAYAYMLKNQPFAVSPKKPPRKREFSIPLIDLLRPNGYWPMPLSIEQAFELFRWMVETGSDSKYSTAQRWGYCGPIDLLSATSGIGHSSIIPIRSVQDLRERFHYAVLSVPSSEGQIQWRDDFDINVNATITLKRPTYKPFAGASHLGWNSESEIDKALTGLLTDSSGKRMAVSLNSVHKEIVNWFHHVRIGIYPTGENREFGFSFMLTYGCDPSERGASCWGDTIARTRKGESFLDTMARARDVFDLLVRGKANNADAEDMFEYKYSCEPFIRDQIDAIKAPKAV